MATYILKRLSKLFSAMVTRPGWRKNNSMYDAPPGAVKYEITKNGSGYGDYNSAWLLPGFIGKGKGNVYISSFVLDDYSSNVQFIKDYDKLNNLLKDRVNIILNDFKWGRFVFDDDDYGWTRRKLSNPEVYKGWKGYNTHWLGRFQGLDPDVLPYSKDLDGRYRLTYKIHRPEREGNKWVSHIELSRCNKHMYEDKSYSES